MAVAPVAAMAADAFASSGNVVRAGSAFDFETREAQELRNALRALNEVQKLGISGSDAPGGEDASSISVTKSSR